MNVIDKKEIVLPKPFSNKEDIYNALISEVKMYMNESNMQIIEKAYNKALMLHKDQRRKSGEEYIIHPLDVALILAKLHMDLDTVVAGLLHDTVEDTDYTVEDCTRDFSEHIALIVDGVTKLTQINLVNDKVEIQAANLMHMFMSMSKDIRVIIVKLADRLHNLMTLEYQSKEKQEEKSLETIEIYSPIANRLGISKIKTMMDDLALRYLKPKEYYELQTSIKIRKDAREEFIDKIILDVKEKLQEANINVDVYGRVKNLFSIYKKMKSKHKNIDEIYDLFAIRILVKDIKDCYAALGIIHEYYTPIPGRFKDYIAMPKQNNYQSLHTTVFGKDGIPFEIQIRTFEMHEIAEYGIAAHWAYKENGDSKVVKDIAELNKMNWLKDIIAMTNGEDSKSFLSSVKSDFDEFTERIYCFTPTGDVIKLPKGACPVDFAYAIHSAVGNKMVGAKANGVLVPIDYQIKNGDQISILTSGNSKGPSRDWLNLVKSPGAKNKIMHWFKQEKREENIEIGKELIEKYAKSKNIKLDKLLEDRYIKEACKKYTTQTLEDLYAMVGHGGLKESQLIAKLQEEYLKENEKEITDTDILQNIETKKEKQTTSKGGIVVKGVHDLAVKYAKCCSPVPGDEIVGFVTRGRGITIHRTDCKNILSLPDVEKNRLIEASFEEDTIEKDQTFNVFVNVYCDMRNGIIVDVSRMFAESNITIVSIETKVDKNEKMTMIIGFSIKGKDELKTICEKVRSINGVISVDRV